MISRHYYGFMVLAGAIAAGAWWYYRTPVPTVLSFRPGQTFEEVVRKSTYPVLEHSVVPTHTFMQSGETFVTAPAVILCFDDARHGFTLPPTKFAMIGYDRNHVATVSTSPMLKKLPFSEAVAVLEDLQNQFKAGGWIPYKVHDSEWFDLTPEGTRRLHAAMFERPFLQQTTLRVPNKYAMTFRLKCAEGCWTREPPYLFLIDIGLSHDAYGSKPGDPPIWERSHPSNQTPAGSARFRCRGARTG